MNQLLFLLSGEPVPRLFGMDPQTFIIVGPLLVNFILLAVLLTFILYKPVRAFLHERADRVNRELDEAESTRKAAIALKEQYEQLLKNIEQERTAILDDARKQALERRVRDLAETKNEIDALKARTNVDISTELERVKDRVEQAIIDVSTEMAVKLLHVTIDPAIHNRLFDEAMADLENTLFKPATPAETV